jgi:catechol 2,3-dioxygenase-like lactoylglutathione lyase family enzyme
MKRLKLLIVGAVVIAVGSSVAPGPSAPAGMRLATIAISVRSLDASVAWYEGVLGLRLADRKQFPEQGLSVALLESSGLRLELVELKGSVSPGSCTDVSNPASLRGVGKYGFEVADLDATVALLIKRGATIAHDSRAARAPDSRSVIIKDNDGNWLELAEEPR